MQFGIRETLRVLYPAKCEINSRTCHACLFGHLVFEVPLRIPSHDPETAMGEGLRIDHGSFFPSKPKQPLRAQTDRCYDRTHFRLVVSVEANTVLSVAVQIA